MAILTWRNVDTPDLRGSLQGLAVAGSSFDRAIAGLNQGIDKFDTFRKEQAEGAVLNNALGYTDPTALRAALANGQVFGGVDRSLLSRQALGALDSRVSNLLSQATSEQQLKTATQLDPLRIDAAKLGITKTQQDINFNEQANPLRIQDLGLGLDQKRVSIANTRQGMSERAQNMALRAQERQDAQLAAAHLATVQTGIVDAQGAREYMASPKFQELSPKARLQAQSAIGTLFPGAIGPITVPDGASGGGSGKVPDGKVTVTVGDAAAGGQAGSSAAEIRLRAQQEGANTITPQYLKAMQDTESSIGQVADRMLASGSYSKDPNMTKLRLMTEFDRVRRAHPNLTPAAIGVILEQNPSVWGSWAERNLTLGPDVVPNRTDVDKVAANVARGDTFTATQRLQEMEAQAAGLERAKAAEARTASLLREAEKRPGILPDQLARIRNQHAMANAELQALIARQQVDPSVRIRKKD